MFLFLDDQNGFGPLPSPQSVLEFSGHEGHYLKEVRFYQQLKADLEVRTPTMLFGDSVRQIADLDARTWLS